MKIVPIGENIVVKRLEAEEVTAGGIVLPDAAKEKPRQGRVLSVGDGRSAARRRAGRPSDSAKATASSSTATPAPKSASTAIRC